MITRSALIWLSRHEGLKDFATSFRFFKKLTTRFVAGDTIDEVIPIIREINAENATASFDHLNESVESAAEAEREVDRVSEHTREDRRTSHSFERLDQAHAVWSWVSIRSWPTRMPDELLKRPSAAAIL